jgi:hypothetical protein
MSTHTSHTTRKKKITATPAFEPVVRAFPEPFDIIPDKDLYYEFKVSLKYISPHVWRRIRVSGDATMWELSNAILEAMGWAKSHLHGFRFAARRPADAIQIGFPGMDAGWLDPENKTRLLAKEKVAHWFVLERRPRAILDYDYGDGWEHEVVLERVMPKEQGVRYPQCVKGKHACPPDDCGGVGGFEHLVDVVRHGAKDEDDRDMLAWYLEMSGLDETEGGITPTWEEFDVFHPEEVVFSTRAELKEEWEDAVEQMRDC